MYQSVWLCMNNCFLSRFFTLIPHDFGMKSPPLLDNADLVNLHFLTFISSISKVIFLAIRPYSKAGQVYSLQLLKWKLGRSFFISFYFGEKSDACTRKSTEQLLLVNGLISVEVIA